MKRNILLMVSAVLMLVANVHAQEWPTRPVTIVVPYPPGGNVDGAARIIAPGLSKAFGQSFIIENKAGAGGMIAGEYVARAKPDGYTLFLAANGPLLFSPIVFGRSDYQWERDFEPISSVSLTPMVLEVSASSSIKTFQELISLAKKEPGVLNMASPGAGTSNHLLSELLQSVTGAKWTTIQYKGNAPAMVDLLGGRVDFGFDQISVGLPFIQRGKLRALAVTSDKRVLSLPDIPTLEEEGVKGAVANTFTGLLAPKGTPKNIVDRLSAALKTVLQDKEVIRNFQTLGAEAISMTPQEFTQYISHEDKRWTPIIKKAGISAR